MHEILERLDSELAASLHGLDTRQTQLAPKTHLEKWTIQQIVHHLLLTYQSTARLLQTRIDKGSPTKARPTVLHRVQQLAVVSLGYFPRRRMAPAEVTPSVPVSLSNGDELTRKVRVCLSQMDQAAEQAEQLFGNGRCASHFILGPMSAVQWRRFHLVHGSHHAKQILEIRKGHGI
jgi:hypothetical protein